MSDTTTATVISASERQTPAVRPLRIVIAGGQGRIGRLISQRFRAGGQRVTTLTRKPVEAQEGTEPWLKLDWDGKELGPWVVALEGADVLINLCGRSVDCRYNAANREEIMRSRVDSTRVLGQAIQSLRQPPRVWLNASTATIYAHSYDRVMDEFTKDLGGEDPPAPPTWRFSIDVARQWEEAFYGCATRATRKVALRAGMVMNAEEDGTLAIVLRLVRFGLGGAWGDGRQYMSWIHELDFFRALEFLIEREDIAGAVNVTAPNPIPNDAFLAEIRKAWGIPFGLPSFEWILSIGALVLRTETELLLKSRRVVPAVLRNNAFHFQFPDWPEAVQDLVRQWKNRSEHEK